MALVKSDPASWLSLLADDRNSDLVGHVATDVLSKGLSKGEFLSFSGLPQVRSSVDMASKTAQYLSGVSAMLSRSAILSDKRNVDLDKKLDKILEGLEVKKSKRKGENHKSDTKVDADDEDAEDFVLDNGEQIARILNGMKSEGLVE